MLPASRADRAVSARRHRAQQRHMTTHTRHMNDPQEFPCYSALAGAVFYHPDRFSSTAFHVATVVPIGRSVRQWTVREDEARASEAQRFGLQFARFHIDSIGADRAAIDHEAMVAILNGALREHVAQGRMQEA